MMPLLRDDLLNPIPGENPSGADLYYSPVFDKIKEARLEDEDTAPQREWQKARKKADFVAVIKLAGDALANQSKDLQLAAWLTEAHLRRDGLAALPECLDLVLDLQKTFWDTIYPPIEDGSPERRATPQEWFAARCDYLLRRISLTSNKLDWLKYRESRSVGYEEDVGSSEEKTRVRQEAIDDGKITAEEFDEALSGTPKSFYENLSLTLDAAFTSLGKLDTFCEQKYGDLSPNFSKLRGVLEEIKQTAHVLIARKRETEPDEAPPQVSVAEGTADEAFELVHSAASAPSPVRNPRALALGEPKSADDAFALVALAADYLAKVDAASAVPYLLRRALRWGELLSQGESPDPASFVAPSTELRQQLKRLCSEGNWEELLSVAEAAVASPCGRGWLDLQRYSWQSCDQLSHSYAAEAICSVTRSLLRDYPNFPRWALADDTPTANAETTNWIAERVIPREQDDESGEEQEIAAGPVPVAPTDHRVPENGRTEHLATAMKLAKSGKMAEAVESLSREASREASGRERFQRQLELSRLCVNTGHFTIATPILQKMVADVERRGLYEWEDASLLAQPLILLLQCMDRTKRDPNERARVYDLLCRLEPAYALQLEKQA
jgi:type VI secretion system protein ImpA